MLFELRQYQAKPGKRDDFVRLMEAEIIPFQVSKGMVIVGSFTGEEDDNLYVWIRRFDDEAQRVAQYEAVYQSDYWVDDVSPRVGELLHRDTISVTRMNPTALSMLK